LSKSKAFSVVRFVEALKNGYEIPAAVTYEAIMPNLSALWGFELTDDHLVTIGSFLENTYIGWEDSKALEALKEAKTITLNKGSKSESMMFRDLMKCFFKGKQFDVEFFKTLFDKVKDDRTFTKKPMWMNLDIDELVNDMAPPKKEKATRRR
jgi:hypothetical protein